MRIYCDLTGENRCIGILPDPGSRCREAGI